MRICIVTIAGYVHGIGGMQRHTVDLARGLAAAGHDVEVITGRHPDGLPREHHDGVLWHFVDSGGNQVDPRWHAASYEAFMQIHGAAPFDIIHSESTCALGLVRKGVQHRVPIAVKYHGNFLGLAKANVRRAVRRHTVRAVAQETRSFLWLCGQHFPRGNWWRFHEFESMVPSRQQIRDQCISHVIPRKRMHVVPNGVDTSVFHPRPRSETRTALGLGPEPIVLALGRLNREKGHHTAIAALAQLPPPTRLVLVGDGEDRQRLESLAAESGVRNRVTFAGGQRPNAVAAYLASADAFVFPTERDEGAPMVLVEAMASGIPVVATDIEQIAEVVDRDGENGFLIPAADPDATAVALRALLSDPARARTVGERGRERVLGEYTLERMVERTVAVYELAIERGSASRR